MPALTSLAIAGGVAAAVGGTVAGGVIQADAAKKAARAQLSEAEKNREFVLQQSAATPQEIKLMNQAIAQTESGIARQERLLNAVDPALIEAGQQALQMLQGKDAQILEPLRRERELQKQELRARLSQRMGPGFETSTPGIQALAQFDRQTSDQLANAQFSTLQGLLGSAQATRNQLSPFTSINALGSLQDIVTKPQTRSIAGATQTPIAPYAGAPFVGQAQAGNMIGQVGGLFGSLAGYGLMAGAGGAGGGAANPHGAVDIGRASGAFE